jgi:asparagine N-glycosylation enzyme membrane subunit Stt3
MIRLSFHHSLVMTMLNSVFSLTDFCTYTPVFFGYLGAVHVCLVLYYYPSHG